MRIAVVGPTHPYKGGVAAHTTATAHALAGAGHDVHLVSWSRLYPHRLYPGDQTVPGGGPDVEPFDRTTRPLRWDRPASWVRVGRSLRSADLVVLVVVVPAQVPALWVLLRACRGLRRGAAHRPRVVVLAHNVVPHETHPGGEWLMNRMLRAADGVVVHSAEQARLAREHGARDVVVADLPPHLPGGTPPSPQDVDARRPAAPPLRVLALGLVRRYKGFDVLLRAAAQVPEVRVTVAGEQWGQAGAELASAAQDPALAGRVELRPGYVPAEEVPDLLAGHHVLALPYRHATASQNVLLGHAYGMPVLASTVGTFGEQVRDGVDGLLVPPDDEAALAAALRRLTEAGELARLRAGVPAVDLTGPWDGYVAALTGAALPSGAPAVPS